MHSAMREQAECTRAGLEYLHVSAKKAAVDALCSEQKQETDEAVARYNTGEFRSMKYALRLLIVLYSRAEISRCQTGC